MPRAFDVLRQVHQYITSPSLLGLRLSTQQSPGLAIQGDAPLGKVSSRDLLQFLKSRAPQIRGLYTSVSLRYVDLGGAIADHGIS